MFTGQFSKGIANGFGILTWKNGQRYEGNFINGDLTGRGLFMLISKMKI
jgi:hypothetical protein